MKLLPGCLWTTTGLWENEKAFLIWMRCREINGHNSAFSFIVFALCQGQLAASSWGSQQSILLNCLWRFYAPPITSAVLLRLIYISSQTTWLSPTWQDFTERWLAVSYSGWGPTSLSLACMERRPLPPNGKVKGYLLHFWQFASCCI